MPVYFGMQSQSFTNLVAAKVNSKIGFQVSSTPQACVIPYFTWVVNDIAAQ